MPSDSVARWNDKNNDLMILTVMMNTTDTRRSGQRVNSVTVCEIVSSRVAQIYSALFPQVQQQTDEETTHSERAKHCDRCKAIAAALQLHHSPPRATVCLRLALSS